MAELDWSALRRVLRGCGIAGLFVLAFFVFWDFAVPAGRNAAPGHPLGIWFVIVPFSFVVPCGFALPVSAGRRLWRAGRRWRAFGPVAFSCLSLFAAFTLLQAFWALVSLPFVLLASAALSAYLIVSTPVAAARRALVSDADAAASDRDFNPDDPSGYARDVAVKRGSKSRPHMG
jgi:hypothetical protein